MSIAPILITLSHDLLVNGSGLAKRVLSSKSDFEQLILQLVCEWERIGRACAQAANSILSNLSRDLVVDGCGLAGSVKFLIVHSDPPSRVVQYMGIAAALSVLSSVGICNTRV